MSKGIHGEPRAGDSGDGIVVVPPIETIDATAVDTSFFGHSYYGDNRTVISDLYSLHRDGKTASERFGMTTKTRNGNSYWAFIP